MKDTGALVIAVGITNEVNTTELRGIASADEYVITARSFLELEAKLEEIIDSACSLIVDPPDRIGPPGMLKVYNKVVFIKGMKICLTSMPPLYCMAYCWFHMQLNTMRSRHILVY